MDLVPSDRLGQKLHLSIHRLPSFMQVKHSDDGSLQPPLPILISAMRHCHQPLSSRNELSAIDDFCAWFDAGFEYLGGSRLRELAMSEERLEPVRPGEDCAKIYWGKFREVVGLFGNSMYLY